MEENKKLNYDERIMVKSAEKSGFEMPASFSIRKEREEMIKRGIEFPRTSELTYIDDKGNLVEI